MQPLKYLAHWLGAHADARHALFRFQDLRALYPQLGEGAFKTLLSRAVTQGLLERLCRGLYFYPRARPYDGLLLYHTAALLRAHTFQYLSFESVLSEAGVIAQVPLNRITLMSSGRSYTLSCGRYGTIEFVHTNQKPNDLAAHLTYDRRCGLWRASVFLALRDMQAARRSLDLIDWESAREFI